MPSPTPFEITVEFASPVSLPDSRLFYGFLPPLDSVLGKVWATQNPSDSWMPELPIPLERFGQHGVYCGSLLIPTQVLSSDVEILPRMIATEMLRAYIKGPELNPSRGEARARATALNTITIQGGTWYGYGDIDQVQDLLSGLTHIGRKVGIGFGRLRRPPKIQANEQNLSCVSEDGTLQRPIPVEDAEDAGFNPEQCPAILGWYPPTPPYWETVRSVWSYLPRNPILSQI